MILNIYRAADAFLYFPTYIAEEYKIFDTLLENAGITDVEVKFPEPPSGGSDSTAIEYMLRDNKKEGIISIAIADPMGLFKLDESQKSEVKVIGAIINKLPFWAVNHIDRKISNINEFKEVFTTVIHYKESLSTGYYLGRLVRGTGINNYYDVSWGQEIAKLKATNGKDSLNKKAVAITADIITLAKEISKDSPELKINYSFVDRGDFLTTGVITSTSFCNNNEIILSIILEGIQKAISILYSSEKMASFICKMVAKEKLYNKVDLNDIEIKKIIKLIHTEKFYPADLNISEESWDEALNAYRKTEWDTEDNTFYIGSFRKYVDNKFIIKSEKSIANQFGITIDTFAEDIKILTDKISNLENPSIVWYNKILNSAFLFNSPLYLKWFALILFILILPLSLKGDTCEDFLLSLINIDINEGNFLCETNVIVFFVLTYIFLVSFDLSRRITSIWSLWGIKLLVIFIFISSILFSQSAVFSNSSIVVKSVITIISAISGGVFTNFIKLEELHSFFDKDKRNG